MGWSRRWRCNSFQDYQIVKSKESVDDKNQFEKLLSCREFCIYVIRDIEEHSLDQLV